MTRHDTPHDTLKQEVAQQEASLEDFKEVRQEDEEDEKETNGLNPENPQSNRFY